MMDEKALAEQRKPREGLENWGGMGREITGVEFQKE